ncbi:MAG: rfbF [Candidatus Angelobacter sp.]|nr:rfbF [Candidatus Angelobacter sp.]
MVAYNPDSMLEENIRALLVEVARLIVVDNGSEPSNRSVIADLAATHNFDVIWSKENAGLAAALNTGIRRALSSEDYDWIATFDQDSKVSAGFSEAMLAAYESCPFRDKIAIIGPHHVLSSERPAESLTQGDSSQLFQEIPVTLQSGSLFSASALKNGDLFDESFFIDYVDFEFCLRLRKRGFRIVEATRAPLYHRLGIPTTHTFFNKTCMVFNHSPVRRYYAARNRLRVYVRYLFSDPRWIGHDAWSWCKEIIKLILFEEDRLKKLAYMVKGAWHALSGRTGVYAR